MDRHYPEQENPLIWPLLSLFQQQPYGWKIHTLATMLTEQKILNTLSADPNQDLFKKNFLLMNALYQLQAILLPEQWLNVEAMDIRLVDNQDRLQQIACNDPLRDYYLDWQHLNIATEEIDALLMSFWQRYRHVIGNNSTQHLTRTDDLSLLGLKATATLPEIRHQWRKLALQWHPDRPSGDIAHFRRLCEAWQRLKP